MEIYAKTDETATLSRPKHNKLPGVRLKILIVDDDPGDREIFKQFLNSDGPSDFLYAEAATGRDGLRVLQSFNPDCILLDFNLPDLDGLRMIRLLHDGRDFLPCAVVMLTGTGNEEVAVEAMKLGVMDYMAKGPASAYALSRTVASAVQRFRFRQEIERQRPALEQRNLQLEAIRGELFDEKERYRVLAEAIPQLVWAADSDGIISYGNQRLWDFHGSGARSLPLDLLVHADDRNGLRSKWSEAVSSGSGFESEVRLHRAKDQMWRWHLMRTVPMRTTDGGPVNWFGTFTDVEDQKRAEEALRRREKLDSIGLLAGGIAHDFNNLLAAIMCGTSFALDSMAKDHSAYPMLEIVLGSTKKAALLTQQLLAYAGQAHLYLEPTDMVSLVSEACNVVRSSVPGTIHLAIETEDDIPLLRTNRSHVQQVIVNLVMNAVEAIGEKEGRIAVRTAVKKVAHDDFQMNVLGYELSEGQYVSVEVSDSGPGIDEQTVKHIFDPFFTTKFTGRGLGLAVVQGVVRSLGGGLRVTSVAGQGSTFRFVLPLREAIPDAAQVEELKGIGADGSAA